MREKRKHTVNSFFAGIGGFDLAFEKSGFQVNFRNYSVGMIYY